MRLITILCLVLLSPYSYSQEVIPEVETVTRDGLIYHQLSTEPLTGTVVSFYDDGRLESRQTYRDGERNDLSEVFYENGQLMIKQTFIDGKLEGLWEGFHDNGQLWVRTNYVDGEGDGLQEKFSEDGNLLLNFSGGYGNLTMMWENGLLIISEKPTVERNGITYHRDMNEPVTGIDEEFHYNGQLWLRRNYIDGKLNGLYDWFHDNGQLQVRTNYIDGKEEGLSEIFDKDGNLTATRTFRNGVFVGSNYDP